MIDQRRIQLMLRNPKAMMDFTCTGRLPTLKVPASPLITLIESIPPRYRSRITQVLIGPSLGYQGNHRFHNLAQAMNWLKPSYTAASYPSESWRLKQFAKPLSLEDLKLCCKVPEQIEAHLMRHHKR